MRPQAANPVPWWVTAIVLPAVFLLLGALIGFFGTWIRDKLDSRRAKQAFLKAIRRELESLEKQLDAAIAEIEDSKKRMVAAWHVPQFSLTFRTTVYTSQLGKLKDVADPLLLEVVEIYSDVFALSGIVELLNRHSSEALTRKPPEALRFFGQRREEETDSFLQALGLVGSACQVLLEQLGPIRTRVRNVLPKLPG